MSPTPRRWVAYAASLGLALLALGSASSAAASAGESSCGVVAVRIDARAYFWWSMNSVHATGVACTAARAVVHDWAFALATGRLPARVVLATNARGVIVMGRFGPPYGFEGYTCRWKNVRSGPHPVYLPGDGRCSSGAATISWSFHGALNPTVGQVRGCPGWVVVGPAEATTIRTRAMSCAGAKRIIRYLLVHRLIRPARHRGLRLVRTRVLGFHFSVHGLEFSARRGRRRFSFRVDVIVCGC